MKLSIVIPTYNRNHVVRANLGALLAQLEPGVELRLLDNASPTPVADTLAGLLAPHAGADIRIIRHRTNIGACANILRSFEVAASDWLWILGDDDVVSPTAVRDILACIAARPEVAFINFSTETMQRDGARPQSFDTRGQAGFVDGLDHSGNVNFMSVCVWHVPSILPHLGVAYNYAYSMSPTFVLLLSALGTDRVCHFSREALIRQVTTVEAAGKWRFRDFILGWNTILELPMSAATRRTLAAKMKSWHSPENVCVYLLAEAAINGRDSRDYVLASRRLAAYVSPFERLRFLLYRVLFIAPTLGWRVVQGAVNLAVRLKLKGANLTDIVERCQSVPNVRV